MFIARTMQWQMPFFRMELGSHPVCMAAGLPSLDVLSMAQAQQSDAEVQTYHTAISGLVLSDVPLPGTDKTLLCDTLISAARPIVPHSWWQAVFDGEAVFSPNLMWITCLRSNLIIDNNNAYKHEREYVRDLLVDGDHRVTTPWNNHGREEFCALFCR